MKKQLLLIFLSMFAVGHSYLSAAKVNAVGVSIEAIGWMETTTLNNGTVAYANRTYVYGSVAEDLKGLNVTRYNGGTPPGLRIKTKASGDMYIAISNEDQTYNAVNNGWTLVNGLTFSYNDNKNTAFYVYKKTVSANEDIEIISTGWQGVLILSSESISFSLTSNFTPPPGVVIHNSKASSKRFIGSPSIVVLEDGTYLASHDYFGDERTQTFVYKSTDKGATWTNIAHLYDLKWSTIFRRNSEIYLLGVNNQSGNEYGNTVVLKSTDNGVNWTSPTSNKNGLILNGYYHCAPVPVTKHNGRIWRAMEENGDPNGPWGRYSAFMMSIDENADLLDASNWTISNKLTFNAGPNNYGSAWLEGNAVVAKDGSMKNILRVHYGQDDIAAIIDISADGKTASFDSTNGFTYLPGALKKFTIRYDEKSEKYWTLSSYVLPEDRGGNLERTRNTIALCSSTNLKDWKVVEILLHVDEMSHHGFQYLDWLVEGDDIIAVSRTAWDDETGQADSQHNANYITFHRFKNFRYSKPASVDVSVKRWFNDAESAIALTFDDGFKAHYEHAFPILKQYNMPSTFFVNSGNLVKRGETQKERYGFWEDFKEMADAGFEIASHSYSHPDLTTISYSVLVNELKKDKEQIETNIGKPCYTHAYPYCNHNDYVDMVANSLFLAGRQCGEIANASSLDEWNWTSLDSKLLTWTYPRSLSNEQASYDAIKEEIETKVTKLRKFGVLCIHEVLPFDLLSTSSTYEIATTEWLKNVCQYLDEKRNAGKIWPTTFGNIVRYAKERDNMRIDKIQHTTDSITYNFSSRLDTAIYNLPLSVEIPAPKTWSGIIVTIKEGDKVVSSSQMEAATSVKLNIIPERQHVELTNAKLSSIINDESDNQITIYPNPVKNVLFVKIDSDKKNLRADIFSLSGYKVMSETIENGLSLNLENLPSGSYIIKIDNKHISRFIKN